MRIQVELPDDVAHAIAAVGEDIARTAEQSIAIEGYRSGRLSEEQLRRMLGFGSSFQVHAFLKDHNVYLNYTDQDLDRDLETARKFSAQWSSSRTPHPSTI